MRPITVGADADVDDERNAKCRGGDHAFADTTDDFNVGIEADIKNQLIMDLQQHADIGSRPCSHSATLSISRLMMSAVVPCASTSVDYPSGQPVRHNAPRCENLPDIMSSPWV